MMSSLIISKWIFIKYKLAITISFVNFVIGLALGQREVSLGGIRPS
jgi:hypothetical protein